MAETSKGKKFLRVKGYQKADGTRVATHDRSTPRTSRGAQPKATRTTRTSRRNSR
jgi:hypothetical protein